MEIVKYIVMVIYAIVCVALLCHLIKYIKSRKVFYPVSVVLAGLVTAIFGFLIGFPTLKLEGDMPQFSKRTSAAKRAVSQYSPLGVL